MSQGAFPNYDSDVIDMTNADLVSLFLRYPDMHNDEEDNKSAAPSDFGEEADSSTFSANTTHTTPLRNGTITLLGSRSLPLFPVFIKQLNKGNLPQKVIDYFEALGHMILQVGRLLFPPN